LPTWRTFGFGFITGQNWAPPFKQFGALPYIYGTVVTATMALVLAAPIGVGCAIFVTELAPPRLRGPLAFLIELLAAVPSVIFGLWGIFVFAPWLRRGPEKFLVDHFGFIPLFKGPAFGLGIFAAGAILALMIVPYITSVSREVMLLTPRAQREGMLALGATRWEVIRCVVLPFARSGIVGGSILALGRALGETMAVTMLIGNRAQIKPSLFSQGATMASVIANEFAEAADSLYTSSLIAVALLLLGVALVMNVLGRLFVWSVTRSR
jgi:phosphate transport system permease protein